MGPFRSENFLLSPISKPARCNDYGGACDGSQGDARLMRGIQSVLAFQTRHGAGIASMPDSMPTPCVAALFSGARGPSEVVENATRLAAMGNAVTR